MLLKVTSSIQGLLIDFKYSKSGEGMFLKQFTNPSPFRSSWIQDLQPDHSGLL
jgi:hypothetical protein